MARLSRSYHHAHFRRLTGALAAVVAAAAVTAIAPSAAAQAAPAAAQPGPRTAPDEASARALATSTGARVEVTSERTEYNQMFAEPTGRFTYESAVVPQRVHRADGSWADVDLGLAGGADGLLRPRASVADVRFSAGGSGPLVMLVRGGQTLTLSWPLGALPAPAVSGDSATYANVLPDVDLTVRATSDGFSHVLVVKSAAAAANPQIKTINFHLGGTAQFRRARDGSLTAIAGSAIMASAAPPAMWDSPAAPAAAARSLAEPVTAPAEGVDAKPSSVAAPADDARTANVGTALDAAHDLVLKPDAALLASASFPLYIDPAWSTGKSRWAYSTNNNSNNTDTSRARVGKDPSSGVIYRSYFEFPISAIKKKYVYDAYVQAKVDHSYSCASTPNTIFSTSPIASTPRTAWKSTSWYTKMLAQVSSHANEGAGCSDSPQPDMTINFNTDAVKSVVQAGATAGSSTITFVISAVDSSVSGESTQDRWKKYYPDNTKLITDVDAVPGVPTEQYVNGVRCGTSTIRIGATAVKFTARMPDADTTQAIKATWQWQKLSGSTWSAMTAPATSSAAANTIATSATLSGATNGVTYRFSVKGTDPSPYNQSSTAYSAWCQFTIDTSSPQIDGVVVQQPAGPGRPGQFKIRSTSSDVAKFRYGWNAAVNEITTLSTETVDAVTYKYAIVTLTPPKYGHDTLFVRAIDSTGNIGDGSIDFDVARPSPAVAHWGLETYPGTDAAAALADQQYTLAGDTPLTANAGVTWTDKHHIVGGLNATFGGAGSLATAGTVLDTTKSFGVGAWVRLDRVDVAQTIVSQDGANTANFLLQALADKSFCFTMRSADTAATTTGASACAAGAATTGRWTHVAGAYDAAEKILRIWVDGVLKAEVPAPATTWASSGALRLGNRLASPGAFADYLSGSVRDGQAFDRAVVQEDLTGQAVDPDGAIAAEPGMLTPIQVGAWNFNTAVPCYDTSIPDTCNAPDAGTGLGQRLRFTQGIDVQSDSGGQYALLDDQPLDGSTGVTTQEYGVGQRNIGDSSTPVWQDTPVLNTDESYSVSVRVYLTDAIRPGAENAVTQRGSQMSPFYLGSRQMAVDGVTATHYVLLAIDSDKSVGDTSQTIVAPDVLDDEAGSAWAMLTVTYDAGTQQMSFYVNGSLVDKPITTPRWAATGPLIVGRSWYTPANGTGSYTDQWYGGIDDVHVYQGVLNAAQVAALDATENAAAGDDGS